MGVLAIVVLLASAIYNYKTRWSIQSFLLLCLVFIEVDGLAEGGRDDGRREAQRRVLVTCR